MNFLFSLLGLLGTGFGVLILGGGSSSRETGDGETSGGTPSGPTDPQEPVPDIVDPDPTPPEQTGEGDNSNDGETTTIAEGTTEVMAGRVTTLAPEGDDIQSIRILDTIDHGVLTLNPDNTLALVMTQSDYTGPMTLSYETTHADGSTEIHDINLNVIEGLQDRGWATGESHYMLETDANDRVIVEHGDDHTKVYVSGSERALSLDDIAALEGMSVDQITGDWLLNHSTYGQSEDTALAEDAGTLLWQEAAPRWYGNSNWLMLERGYTYDELCEENDGRDARLIQYGTSGDSELNPVFIGAWGEGDRPEITNRFMTELADSSNVVIQDIHFSGGIFLLNAHNFVFDNVLVTGSGASAQDSSGITFRNSEFLDIHTEEPADGGDTWQPHINKNTALYSNYTDGILLENLFFDRIGWEEDYHVDGSAEGGQPPSQYSHNIYLGHDIEDLTLRDTITMRAASYGAQMRSGGFFEDNLFLDNNAQLTFLGGDYQDAGPIGHYTLMSNNVITSGAHKVAPQIGGLTLGVIDGGQLTTLVDNIITHLSDPNNPDELDYKTWTHSSLISENAFYDDTIVWNWEAQQNGAPSELLIKEQNVEGLDPDVLDQTTIQLFAAQLLGNPDATITDLANYLRAQAGGELDEVVDADLIINFFQTGFGITPDIRDVEATLRFVPNELGDGIRWDNRMNWDTDDLPGTQDGDSVDLGGNHVVFGSNVAIDTLDFGEGGALNVYGGKLTVEGGMKATEAGQIADATGGHLNVEGAGQAWINGSDGSDIDVTLAGGRFVNTGDMSGADLTASGGQTILATDGAEFDVSDGHRLTVEGSDAKVGFDGATGGMAILDLHDDATLAFEADADGLATIEEFRSGAMGDAPNVQSGIDLGGSTINIDLSALPGDTLADMMLMSSDELVGLIDGASVNGLGARDATITIDYAADTVTLSLTAGSGLVSIETTGNEDDVSSGYESLWDTLTADHGVLSEDTSAMLLDDEAVEDDTLELIL